MKLRVDIVVFMIIWAFIAVVGISENTNNECIDAPTQVEAE